MKNQILNQHNNKNKIIIMNQVKILKIKLIIQIMMRRPFNKILIKKMSIIKIKKIINIKISKIMIKINEN